VACAQVPSECFKWSEPELGQCAHDCRPEAGSRLCQAAGEPLGEQSRQPGISIADVGKWHEAALPRRARIRPQLNEEQPYCSSSRGRR
jgi:hypothetical protein